MKTLNLHCDYIRWKGLRKALKNIEDLVPNQVLEGESKDCLVVLIAVEKGDSINSIKELIDSIKKIAAEVKTKNIVISRNKTILLFRILVSPYSNLQNITQTKKPANAGLLLKYYPFG